MFKNAEQWLWAGSSNLLLVLISAGATYAAILIYTRVIGLRSFSKMSAADFAMTVAVGSIFASTISSGNPSLLIGLTALACLFVGQWVLAWLRQKLDVVSRLVDNQPILLMAGDKILDDNLHRANVTRDDLYGKLREANAIHFNQVLAVVFETTGDVSVLHSTDSDATLDRELVSGVKGIEILEGTSILSRPGDPEKSGSTECSGSYLDAEP